MKENRWSTTQFDRPPMTKPRTLEEIAEEWFKIHDGMCVRSIDGQPYREHFLAALREAADTAEAELAAAIKQALEQHRIVQDFGRELRAERAQREKLEKAVQRHLMAIGHDAADETDCDVGFGCTLCELSKALRHDAPWPCGHAKLHHEDELCRECSP